MHFIGRLAVFVLLCFGSLWAMEGDGAGSADGDPGFCVKVLGRDALLDALVSPNKFDIRDQLLPCARAVYCNSLGEFNSLIRDGMAEETDERGITPVHIAVACAAMRGGEEPFVNRLIECGALKKIYYRLYLSIKIAMAALGYVGVVVSPEKWIIQKQYYDVLDGYARGVSDAFLSEPPMTNLTDYREWCYKCGDVVDQCIKLMKKLDEIFPQELPINYDLIQPAAYTDVHVRGRGGVKKLMLELPLSIELVLPNAVGCEYSKRFFEDKRFEGSSLKKVTGLFCLIQQWIEGEIMVFMHVE